MPHQLACSRREVTPLHLGSADSHSVSHSHSISISPPASCLFPAPVPSSLQPDPFFIAKILSSMSDKPNLAEALARIMDLTYPPRTLSIKSSKALGYRLAKPVTARGNQPSRPLSLVDGLAIMSRDLKASAWLKEHAAELGQSVVDMGEDEAEEVIEVE